MVPTRQSPRRCYADFQAIILSKIFSMSGRLIASPAQQRLINFHALSLKGGLYIRGGRFPRETSCAILNSFAFTQGTAPNWICTSIRSISTDAARLRAKKQRQHYPPRNKDSQTHIRPTFASLSSIIHHRQTLRYHPLHSGPSL